MLDREIQKNAVVVGWAGNTNRESDTDDRLQVIFVDDGSAVIRLLF